MTDQFNPAQDSSVNISLSRPQSVGILGGFSALLVAILVWFSQSGSPADVAPTPVEMPAVISQGEEEDVPPAPEAPPTSHQAAVQQEKLQALRDQAMGASFEK